MAVAVLVSTHCRTNAAGLSDVPSLSHSGAWRPFPPLTRKLEVPSLECWGMAHLSVLWPGFLFYLREKSYCFTSWVQLDKLTSQLQGSAALDLPPPRWGYRQRWHLLFSVGTGDPNSHVHAGMVGTLPTISLGPTVFFTGKF